MVLEFFEFTDLQEIRDSLLSRIDFRKKLIEECIKNNVQEDFSHLYSSNKKTKEFLSRIEKLIERKDKYYPLRILSATLSQGIKSLKKFES